jgi:hypothetical protein
MSVTPGWSDASDPLYASSLGTLPNTQSLAAQPQSLLVEFVQSSARYAAMRLPSTPAAFVSVA